MRSREQLVRGLLISSQGWGRKVKRRKDREGWGFKEAFPGRDWIASSCLLCDQ